MTPEQCQQLIDFFENNTEYHSQGGIVENDNSHDISKLKKCTEMYIESEQLYTYNMFENLTSALHASLGQYVLKYQFLNELAKWNIAPTFKIQKYLPNEAYFLLHSEHTGFEDGVCERRMIAWMAHLNDVTDGGETEFPTQNACSIVVKVKARIDMQKLALVTRIQEPPYSQPDRSD